MAKRVAVVGLSFRFPQTDTERYWADLLAGRDLVSEVEPSRWQQDAYLHPLKDHPGTAYTFAAGSIGDVSGFDAQFFGISPREASLMDPQQRLLLELCWETFENAGIKPSSLRGSDCGVYIGIASADYSHRLSDDLDAIDASMATGNTSSVAANRLSYFFDLHGPSMAVDTACSSSLVAIHQACRAIVTGETSLAIAGGISLHLHPYGFITFSKASMLSPDGRCKAFDASGNGYVRSEGGGLFLLKNYDQAVADGDRILAIIPGSLVNTDGRKSGLTVPNVDAQIALMRETYARAGISPQDIDYIEAHGTGTAVGDPIEAQAIGAALGQARDRVNPLPIGSVKSNMGHLETASGVAGLVKAIYSLQHRIVPATIGINELNPAIDFKGWNLSVATQNLPLRQQGTLTIGVNSFGFGGANAHVIVQSAPEPDGSTNDKLANTVPVPVVVTGKTTEALRAAAKSLGDVLRSHPGRALYDVAYHAVMRRDWHQERAVIYGTDSKTVGDALHRFAEGNAVRHSVISGSAVSDAKGPVFVFSGNGSQWPGMGRQLLNDPVFAEAVHEVDSSFVTLAGYRLADELARADMPNQYDRTELAQPALFAIQVGVTRMLAHRGISPIAVIGHSVGEVAAAWACGALSLPDAVKVIFHRSSLQGTTKGLGGMAAIGMDGVAAQALLTELSLTNTLHIAGYNSARGATLAGDQAALAIVESVLAERQVFYKRLDLDYAFHSPVMDALRPGLQSSLSQLAPQAGHTPFLSTVVGESLDGRQLDAEYWWRNIREPVRFEQMLQSVVAGGDNVFVEIGPHPVLRTYVNDALSTANRVGRVLTTATRGNDDPSKIHETAAQIVLSGARVNWPDLFPWVGRHVTLPTYPWQRERHWHPVTPESLGQLQRSKAHPLLGYSVRQHSGVWENRLDTSRYPWLADHVVGDATVFPGAGFVEMALAAAAQRGANECCKIEELEIHAPLLLAPLPPKRVRFTLDETDGAFRVQARDVGTADRWTLHATGRVLLDAGAILRTNAPLQQPDRPADFTADEHYQYTHAIGLDYGPAFRAFKRGWKEADGTIIAQLEPPATLPHADLAEALLDPTLLDNAFQLVVPLLASYPASAHRVAFVPAKIGRLVLSRNNGKPSWVRAKLLRRSPHSLLIDFELFNATGERVATVSNTRFKSIRLSSAARRAPDFLTEVGVPRPHPASPDAHNSSLDSAGLFTALASMAAAAAQDGTHARYAQEIEPLLDSLCDRFLLQAIQHIAADGGHLHDHIVDRCRQSAPTTAAFLDHLLARATRTGLLQRTTTGWKCSATPDDPATPGVVDLWGSLVREYPDYAHIIHAAGRVGSHLADLLQGHITRNDLDSGHIVPGALIQHVLGGEVRQRIGVALREQLTSSLNSLPLGRRLSVLEISDHAPAFARDCCGVLDLNRADYSYASTVPGVLDHAQRSLDSYPEASIIPIDAESEVASQALYDLVILHLDMADAAAAHRAVQFARKHIKANGLFLLIGIHPVAWLDFVAGVDTAWWTSTAEDPSSSQYSARFWQSLLNDQGLICQPLIEFAPNTLSGPYLLPATASEHIESVRLSPATSTANTALAPSQAWLLLAGAEASDTTLALSVARRLEAAGHKTLIHRGADTAKMDDILAQAKERLSRLDAIIHMDGLGISPSSSPTELMQSQVRRCALAASTLQALERSDVDATLWIITAGAAQHWATHHANEASLQDAALWGYGRTMMNEAGRLRVRLLDLPGLRLDEMALDALERELRWPDAEQEVAIAKDGSRFSPRLKVAGHPSAALELHEPAECFRLSFEFPGQLRNLRWEEHHDRAPADDEVQVRVQATGLNFRDVMYSLGLLSDEAIENGYAGATLGLEFSGTVLRAGRNAERQYKVGDAVVGFGPASFANRVTTKTDAVAHIPKNIPFEAAATIPSTFFTVYYALHHLAQLEEGEKILIHGAAGGVGIAAIQFAQWRGAEIYATAGSEDKREFLRLLGVKHIYDSRSLAYADEILADTNGSGVDVVLNSLAGEAINRNLQVLKPFGRFLELGKRDFYENTRIGLRPFRNNISYFGIDADQLMRERPALTQRLFGEMMKLFAEGVLYPLPYQEFDANDVVDAFRHMQQARQIGKIVVTYRNGIQLAHATESNTTSSLRLSCEGTYLVTGGLSGFGLRTAQWLAEKGARHLVLVSRSGPTSEDATQSIRALEENGVIVHAAACDVTDAEAVGKLFCAVNKTMPPLKGIVHAAMVIDDGLVRGATADQISRVLAPKILGAAHLDTASRSLDLEFFITFSSATTLFGNPGQANYVAANSWLESQARYRRSLGLPATCVRWGAIEDVGYLARNKKIKEALRSRMGGAALLSDVALQALEQILLADIDTVAVLELDWRALRRFLPTAHSPRFSLLSPGAGENGDDDADSNDIAGLLATLDDDALLPMLVDILRVEVGEILRIPFDRINSDVSIYDMGLDSLMGVELVVALENRFGVRLPVMALNESPTLTKLAGRLLQLLRGGDDALQQAPLRAQVERIVSQHTDELGDDDVDAFAADLQSGTTGTTRMIP